MQELATKEGHYLRFAGSQLFIRCLTANTETMNNNVHHGRINIRASHCIFGLKSVWLQDPDLSHVGCRLVDTVVVAAAAFIVL